MVHLHVLVLFPIQKVQRYIPKTHKIIRQPKTIPIQPPRHPRKTLRLNQVVKRERRKHGPIAVDIRLHEQGRAAHAIELDLRARVGRRVVHHCHERAVGGHIVVALEQDVVLAHFGSHLLRGGAIDPVVVVVGANGHGLLLGVVKPLEAVGGDDGRVVVGEVLDDGGGELDDVGVEPEDPRGGRAEGGEEEGVARFGHGGATSLLVLHLVALGFVLRGEGVFGVLAEDGDGGEAAGFGAGLGLGDLLLEVGVGLVAFFRLGDDEAEGDEVVGVGDLVQVVPVALVEAGEGREDEDLLLVLGGGARLRDVVHVVVLYGGSDARLVCL